ncbi:hypothetical protein [Streptomyces sp. NPDC056045]
MHLAPLCAAHGNHRMAYFAAQGRGTWIKCVAVGDNPPPTQFLLRVTVLP